MPVLAVLAIPFLAGLAIGRWWLLLMLALPATTMFAHGMNAGMPAGPTAAVTLLPVAGATGGVALRAALVSYRRNGGMSMSSSEISSDDRWR
jgi:hypothetical protein